MQSGIAASHELHTAFQEFLRDSQRSLLVGISPAPESLVPCGTIPTKSPTTKLEDDLEAVQQRLSDNEARYIILRQDEDKTQGSATCIAVTFVPDNAPVRQKMLFASTRLTLVRELGIEHFGSTLFITSKDEISPSGWTRNEAHGSLAAPLTEEERSLKGVKEAEAQESTGTGTRKGGHVSSGVSLPIEEQAIRALKSLNAGEHGLVQLEIDTGSEAVKLASSIPSSDVSASSLGRSITETAPRYSFYRHNPSSQPAPTIVFLYTCPPGASIKERMLYASCRSSILAAAADQAELHIANRLEASSPLEVTEEMVIEAAEPKQAVDDENRRAAGRAFSKPKRPGRR